MHILIRLLPPPQCTGQSFVSILFWLDLYYAILVCIFFVFNNQICISALVAIHKNFTQIGWGAVVLYLPVARAKGPFYRTLGRPLLRLPLGRQLSGAWWLTMKHMKRVWTINLEIKIAAFKAVLMNSGKIRHTWTSHRTSVHARTPSTSFYKPIVVSYKYNLG